MENILLIAASFWLAGTVKGAVGLGLPTVAIALLSLLMTPMEAAALLLLPSLLTNLWQLAAGPDCAPLLRRLWPLLLGVCAGTAAGAALAQRLRADWAGGALGLALMVYAALGLVAVSWSVPARLERWLAPLVGAATGVVSAATGVFVLPAVAYLQALGLGRDQLVQAMGLAFTVSTLALALQLAWSGALHWRGAGASALALLPALAGMATGQWLRRKMPQALFRRCFFTALMALGGQLLLRAAG
ncbi:uncharacterized protein ACFDR9_005322 [Janthinobacterium sp. CG_23.3]|uniref:sulfite exporter TauE/SafE family protein n=1 Tax=Janthinobacterium sp. CG_23.3 TaxID=3349634 RepID=UPI0038D4CFD1